MNDYKITDAEISANHVAGADDKLAGSPSENKAIFDKLPKLIAGKFNDFITAVIAKFTEYYTKKEIDKAFTEKVYSKEETYTKEETNTAINNKVIQMGAGDMARADYDVDEDGAVDRADYSETAGNGIFVYTHTAGVLTGSGTNGKFKAAVTETVSSLAVNGTACAVKCGEDSEIELVEGCWYTFILDGDTVNFKQGGAGLNFKIVGSTTQPASPKENTIWINTDTAIAEWQFSATEPTARADGSNLQAGDVWIKTDNTSTVRFNALKKNRIDVQINSAYQYNGSDWEEKEVSSYINGDWLSTAYYLVDAPNNINLLSWNQTRTISNGVIKTSFSNSSKTYRATTGIDVTDYNYLDFVFNKYYSSSGSSDGASYRNMGLMNSSSTSTSLITSFSDRAVGGGLTPEYENEVTKTFDISAVTGTKYVYEQYHAYGSFTAELKYIRLRK